MNPVGKNATSSWIGHVLSGISKRTFVFVCVISIALQLIGSYLALFSPLFRAIVERRESHSHALSSANSRELLSKRLELIEMELEELGYDEKTLIGKTLEISKGQFLKAIDHAAQVSSVKLGPLSSVSPSTSKLSISGTYRAITDFITELSYDSSSAVILEVVLNAPVDWSYPSKGAIDAELDIEERAAL
jgi:hypothetical protein